MRAGVKFAALAIPLLAVAEYAAITSVAAKLPNVPQTASPSPAPTATPTPPVAFVSSDFVVPTLIEAKGFKLVPLGPEVVDADYQAYMSSIEHLQKTFSRSDRWPRAGITAADAMRDMEGEARRFQSRRSFAYAVLTPDGSRERGSVYVSPSPIPGHDAIVRMWVTKADYDAGFDAELYQWVTGWVKKDWPFKNVAYPGRSIDWATWDAMTAKK